MQKKLYKRLRDLQNTVNPAPKFSIESEQKRLLYLYKNNRFALPFLEMKEKSIKNYFPPDEPTDEELKCFKE